MKHSSDNIAEKLKRQVTGKDMVKKYTAYFIFGAIVIVFVLFGFSTKMSGSIGSVARVNDALISLADYQQEEEQVRQYYARIFGGMDFGSQRQMLRQQAIESLIQSELVYQAANSEGILSTDAEVRDFIIRDIPFFQEKGQFKRENYLGYLEQTRSNPADFEKKVRKQIGSVRTRHIFDLSSRPLTIEAAKRKELQENKVNVAFVKIEVDELANKNKVSEAEARKALEAADFLKKAEQDFAANKEAYGQKEEVHAQHILISAKDEASQQKALAKITELQKKAETEDFGKLAEKNSDDPGSKTKKGDLGYFSRGRMMKEFEEVAFATAVGKVSAPVKTSYGWHLIKVLDHKAAKEASFDSMKINIAQKILAREKIEGRLKAIEEAVSKGNEEALQAELKTINAQWDETGFFDLAIDAIPKLQAPTLTEAALELSANKPLLNRVVHESGARYVFKFKGMKKEPVSTDKVSSLETVQRQRAGSLYEAWVNEYKKSAKVEVNQQIFAQ